MPADTVAPSCAEGPLILVAEDEEPVRMLAARLLTELGFRVLVAADGPATVEAARHLREDLAAVLLDVTMPAMTCEEVLAALDAADVRVPLIVTSGSDVDELSAHLADRRVTAVLAKPYRLEDLRVAVLGALGDG